MLLGKICYFVSSTMFCLEVVSLWYVVVFFYERIGTLTP